MNEPLDKLGALVIRDLHDKAVREAEILISGLSKAPAAQPIQAALLDLSDDQRTAVRMLVARATVTALHDFLFSIQTAEKSEIKFTANGIDIAELSDGLHSELFGRSGWIARFSKYNNEE